MSDSNEAMVRRMLELWATRGWDEMAEMFAEDGIYDNVPDKAPMNGREAVRQWLKMVGDHLTRIDVEILNIASKGEWVLNERIDVHVAGDRKMPLPVMNATRIVDGKIVMWRDYYDRKTVDELGLVAD